MTMVVLICIKFNTHTHTHTAKLLTSFLTAFNRLCRTSASAEDILLGVFQQLLAEEQTVSCFKHQIFAGWLRSLILTFYSHTPPHLLAQLHPETDLYTIESSYTKTS